MAARSPVTAAAAFAKFPLTPSADAKGQRVVVSFQCTPSMARQIQDIVYEGRATGRYPWKTRGELIRSLLSSALAQVRALAADGDDDALLFHQLEEQVADMTIKRQAAEHLRDTIATEIDALMQIHDRDAAISRLHTIVQHVSRLESVTWREWLLKALRTRYAHLLDAPTPRVPLYQMQARDVIGVQQRRKRSAR